MHVRPKNKLNVPLVKGMAAFAGLTLGQVAHAMGISPPSLSRDFRIGAPRDRLERLAEVLGVTPETLIAEDSEADNA